MNLTFVEGARDLLGQTELDGVRGQEFGGSVYEGLVDRDFFGFGFGWQGTFDVIERPRIVSAAEKKRFHSYHGPLA